MHTHQLAEFESNVTCHELNYTLIFENREGELLKQVGPFQYYFADSADSVTQLIMADHLEKNETYSLSVQVTIVSETFTSHKHRFSKWNILSEFFAYFVYNYYYVYCRL